VRDNKLRGLIHAGRPPEEMRNHAVFAGMKTLKEAAMVLLKDGITTVDEVIDIVHGI